MTDPLASTGAGADQRQAQKDHIVSLLGEEWAIIDGLLSGLSDAQWSTPALPGWDVHDVVSHLIGTERMLAGRPLPQAPPAGQSGEHVRNEIGHANEAWVAALRDRPHDDQLADFRDITTERLAALRAMSAQDFDAPSWTPVGNATYGRFMQVRVFDCWMHEQDIRAVVGQRGNEEGPIAEQALAEVTAALGYIIGKRGRAPEGSSVRLSLTGPLKRDLHVVVEGRAKVVQALDAPPRATVCLPSSLFFRLAGGREDPNAALDRIELHGDVALSRQLATSLAFTI